MTRLSRHDATHNRGAYASALGAALSDMGKSAAVEPPLCEALTARQQAEGQQKNPNDEVIA